MSETTRWWWIRHAPVTATGGRIYGDSDPPCDVSNREAFQRLARVLPRDALWVTSHLQRTRQTAEAILQHRDFGSGWPPVVEKDLGEQSFGDWQGKTHDEIAEAKNGSWHRFWLSPAHEAPPGGESFEAMMRRVSATVSKLNRVHGGRDIIAITHGGTIRAALALALELTPDRALSLTVDNCALSRIDYFPGSHGSHAPEGEGAWKVIYMNATAGVFD